MHLVAASPIAALRGPLDDLSPRQRAAVVGAVVLLQAALGGWILTRAGTPAAPPPAATVLHIDWVALPTPQRPVVADTPPAPAPNPQPAARAQAMPVPARAEPARPASVTPVAASESADAVAVTPPVSATVPSAVSTPAVPLATAVPLAAAEAAPPVAAERLAPAAPAEARDLPPQAVQYLVPPAPVYPKLSRRLGETGRVLMRVYIDESGLPRTVQVSESSGHARLDEAARTAVQLARFKPYAAQGRPTSGWAFIPLTFDLENRP